MKQYIFPIFIITLGLFTAYLFYAFWHSEEINPPKITAKPPQEKVKEDLSDTPVIPRDTVVVPEHATSDIKMQLEEEKAMEAMMAETEKIVDLTPEQMEVQTQAVYDKLTPENHEDTMEEAAEAFEKLDEYVAKIDEQIEQEMEDIEVSQEGMEEIPAMEDDETDELPLQEEEMIIEEIE